MKEIKFRQPITFLSGKFLKFHYWGFISVGTFASPETTKAGGFIEGALQNSQQFTGLLDKNGKEIYGGDILKWIVLDEDDENNVRDMGCSDVFFEDGKFMAFTTIPIGHFTTDEIEVIGNIYETPELLKVKK